MTPYPKAIHFGEARRSSAADTASGEENIAGCSQDRGGNVDPGPVHPRRFSRDVPALSSSGILPRGHRLDVLLPAGPRSVSRVSIYPQDTLLRQHHTRHRKGITRPSETHTYAKTVKDSSLPSLGENPQGSSFLGPCGGPGGT